MVVPIFTTVDVWQHTLVTTAVGWSISAPFLPFVMSVYILRQERDLNRSPNTPQTISREVKLRYITISQIYS